MGVDFIGHGDLSLHWQAWRACFDSPLPLGGRQWGLLLTAITPARGAEHFTNDLQEVTDEDARALAAALHRIQKANKQPPG